MITPRIPTDICMLVYNRPRITEVSIRELKARTTSPHRLIVLDNGSDVQTCDLLIQLQSENLIDLLLHLDTNTGVHNGHNILLKHVQSDIYVSTDNDIVPQGPIGGQDWLSLASKLLRCHDDYAALSLLPHYLVGDNLSKWLSSPTEIITRAYAGAVLRLMHTDLVRKAGGWKKTRNPSRNNEERWIGKRLAEQGYKVGYCRDIRAIHLWGEPDLDEDPWGYEVGSTHGHRDVWPPPDRYNWHRTGANWETCK
jgi:GT2 family glycosyltransferase